MGTLNEEILAGRQAIKRQNPKPGETPYYYLKPNSDPFQSISDDDVNAVLLNIKNDHIDRHETFERYVSAKSNIFMHQCECDVVVYNDDDDAITGLVPYMKGQRVPFSMTHPVDGAYISSGFVCYKGLPIIEVADLDAKGAEIENVLAAVAVTMHKGISKYTVSTALCSFTRPQFRRAKVAQICGVEIFNDSKATNIASTVSAISAMALFIVPTDSVTCATDAAVSSVAAFISCMVAETSTISSFTAVMFFNIFSEARSNEAAFSDTFNIMERI